MGLNTATTEQNDNHQLIEIRKIKSNFGSIHDYLVFRDTLMSKAINPWLSPDYLLANWLQNLFDKMKNRHVQNYEGFTDE